MVDLKILVSSGSPDRLNNNVSLRHYVSDAFKQLITNVKSIDYEMIEYTLDAYKPDVLLVFGSVMPDESFFLKLSFLKKKHSFILAFWVHDDPYEFDFRYKMEKIADFIFSNDKWAVEHYDHKAVFHLPMAASYEAHYREIKEECEIDIFFCGASYPNRERFMNGVIETLNKYKTLIYGSGWKFHLAKNIKIDNEQLPDYYANSFLTLNLGRDYNLANERFKLIPSTPGPRTFEAAMAGTVQIFFVESLEILDYFNESEIILIDSVKEFYEQVNKLLDNHELLQTYRRNAQQKAIHKHTYVHRCQQFLDILENNSEITLTKR
jgi:spore maturation protein CgeB